MELRAGRPGPVSRLLNNHLTSYSAQEGLPRTFRLAERSDGSLIAGTDKGLARFETGSGRMLERNGIFRPSRPRWYILTGLTLLGPNGRQSALSSRQGESVY